MSETTSEWAYLPLLLGSFLRNAHVNSSLEHYVKGGRIEIPFEHLKGFVVKSLMPDGNFFFETGALRPNLEYSERLDLIKWKEGDLITISKQQYETLTKIVMDTLRNMKLDSHPEYLNHVIRKTYLAALGSKDLMTKYREGLKGLYDELYVELDDTIIKDFSEFQALVLGKLS